jgi:two-component system cell cycle sensor histidine kinase/response regulator CckA
LRDSEALLNKTGSMANIGGWQLDLRTNQLRWTRQVYEIHELDPSYTPTVEAAVRFYTLEAIPILQEALDRAATRGEPFDLVLPFITAKGDERWVRAMGEPAREGDESEQRFRLLAESIEDVFWLSAPELDPFLYVSPAIEKIWKRAPQQLYADARLYTDAIHPEDRPAVLAGIKDDADQAWAFEYRIVQPDGAIRWIYDRSYPIRDEAGTLIRRCGVATDITEQKQRERERERYEEQLRHVRKMEAVGTLASGIAHDFNNLLTAIFGYAGVARRNLSRGHPALFAIDMIEQAGRQASGVTNSLLTFSRKSTASKTPIDLGATIGDALRLLRHALPASIDLVQDMPEPRQIWIRGDATQMQQIMMNLAVNARDAMPDGGELRVSLRTQPHADAANTNESATMPNAVLTVEDSGVGMPEDIRARVFEPFFTTKSRGQGTGLGMSVIHGIITDHGGSVEVESAPGRGSRFIITLPCCPAPSSMVSPTLQAARTRGDGQLVLLVEDNVHVRAIMTSTLRSAGYRVDQAADGFEALDRFEKHPAAFNVVVVDADLPKKSGLACLHEMRGRRPDLPGVLITGGAGADETSRDDEPLTLLRKPFQMTDLLCVIEDLLVAAKEPGGGT